MRQNEILSVILIVESQLSILISNKLVFEQNLDFQTNNCVLRKK